MLPGLRASIHRRWQRHFRRWARPRAQEPLPVRLGHQRIYILPSGFGWFFLALLATMGLGALNYNNNPALILCLLLVGTATASLLFTQQQLSGLVIEAVSSEPVRAGHIATLRVFAYSDSGRGHRGLRVGNATQYTWLSLDQGRGETALPIPTHVRGWQSLDRIEVSSTRPFGMARAWAYLWPDTRLLVYPLAEEAAPPFPADSGTGTAAKAVHVSDEPHHIREWRQGDPRRAISWKASAKRDTLLVREYERAAASDILLGWSLVAHLPHEQAISRLARWVDDAAAQSRRYALALPGQALIGPGAGLQHHHDCLRALALLPRSEAPMQ